MGNYTKWYRVGNVKLVQSSKDVEGTDTYWLTAGLNPGDLFTVDGARFYEVDYITDDTHLTLKTAYQEAGSLEKSYSIVRNFTATMPADIAARTAELLGDFRRYIDTDMKSIHGKSAYELAIEKGYTGTLSEWLEDLKAAQEWTTLRDAQTVLRSDLTAAETWQTANAPYVNILKGTGAQLHNSIARGKNLGTTITAEQSAAIADGSFNDIWIGDYWEGTYTYTYGGQSYTQSVKWVVMDCNYRLNTGTDVWTHKNTTPHVAVMPSAGLYEGTIFASSEQSEWAKAGGYLGTSMHTTGLERAKAIVNAAFGSSHILPHWTPFSSARAVESMTKPSGYGDGSGRVTSIASAQVTVELPVVQMLGVYQYQNTLMDNGHYEPFHPGRPLSLMMRGYEVNTWTATSAGRTDLGAKTWLFWGARCDANTWGWTTRQVQPYFLLY